MTSAREVLESLTGFDELAIEKATGRSLEELSATGRNLVITRALGAVLLSRADEDGKLSIPAAFQKVQAMKQTEVSDLFEDDDEDDEVFDDDPVSESGKDDSEPASEPTTSLASVSQPA